MEPSKASLNLLRKKLRKQKRKTVLLFFIGLLLGASIAFNIYFWFPLLKKEFNLPDIKQYEITKASKQAENSNTTETENKNIEEKKFIPRINTEIYQNISSNNRKLSNQLDRTIDQAQVSGSFLAIKNNQVVLMKNYGNAKNISDNPLETTYMMGSAQKFITATMLMTLIEKEKISLDTPLSEYYPEITNSQNITIDQMLSMTSGLVLKEKLKETKSKKESIEYVLQNVSYEDQDKWHYSDVNYFLLATIIERLTNESYEQYFNDTIKTPLDLTHIGFYNEVDGDTHLVPSYYKDNQNNLKKEPVKISDASYINELGTGNIYTSASDLLTIIQAVIDGRIISPDTLSKTLEKKPAPYSYNYKAGMYDREDNYYSHGIFRGYETVILFNKDASNVTIFLSNIFEKDKSNISLTKDLFTQINEPTFQE